MILQISKTASIEAKEKAFVFLEKFKMKYFFFIFDVF